MGIPNLDEQQTKELLRLIRYYRDEAYRCKEVKAYLAGCGMAGAALEAIIIMMVDTYPEEVIPYLSSKYINKSPLNWDLIELLNVAKKAGWLPHSLNLTEEWNARKAKIGDYAEVLRQIRNLLHPGRYLKDHYRKRITAKHLDLSLDILLFSVDWFLHKVNQSIASQLEEEASSA